MTEKIIARIDGPVARLIINQPEKRNAVSLEMWQAIERALDGFAAEASVRVLVLSGAGDKAFSAGADISRFEDERATGEAVADYNATTSRVSDKLAAFARPTIAEIQGVCIGGGVNLAVCCDLRLAGESARFAIPAARLGLGYGYQGVERVARVVGIAHALEIYYTARQFSAAEALAMGLVNRVVPDGVLDAYVRQYAQMIAENAPLTIAAIKAAVTELCRPESERDRPAVERKVRACFESRDYAEGRRAFMEKRRPAFTGS